MNPARQKETELSAHEKDSNQTSPAEVVSIRPAMRVPESLSENFNHEIDAWARHALARNGFADAAM